VAQSKDLRFAFVTLQRCVVISSVLADTKEEGLREALDYVIRDCR